MQAVPLPPVSLHFRTEVQESNRAVTLTIISVTIAFTAQSPLSRDKVMLRFCCDSGIFLFPAMPG